MQEALTLPDYLASLSTRSFFSEEKCVFVISTKYVEIKLALCLQSLFVSCWLFFEFQDNDGELQVMMHYRYLDTHSYSKKTFPTRFSHLTAQ